MRIVGTMTVEIPYMYDLGHADELRAPDFEAGKQLLEDWKQTAARIEREERGRVVKLEIHSFE